MDYNINNPENNTIMIWVFKTDCKIYMSTKLRNVFVRRIRDDDDTDDDDDDNALTFASSLFFVFTSVRF